MKRVWVAIVLIISLFIGLTACRAQDSSSFGSGASGSTGLQGEDYYIELLEPVLSDLGETNENKIIKMEKNEAMSQKMGRDYYSVRFSVGDRELEAIFRNAEPELWSISRVGEPSHYYYRVGANNQLYDYVTDEEKKEDNQGESSDELDDNNESSKISDSDTPTNGNDSRPAGNDNNTASATKPTENKPVASKAESQKQEPQNPVSSPSIGTAGQSNALKAAKNYLRVMAFSYQGLIQQLEYEGYSHDEAVYGADNCGADWNEQALKSSQNYLSVMPFSYNGLIKQLEYDKYTTEQATYGANNCGANWNEQAVKKAKSYLDIMSFSRDSLIRQLEYDGFTHEQAVYGAEANGY